MEWNGAIHSSSVTVATISVSSIWTTTQSMSHTSDAVTLPRSSAINSSSVAAAVQFV